MLVFGRIIWRKCDFFLKMVDEVEDIWKMYFVERGFFLYFCGYKVEGVGEICF